MALLCSSVLDMHTMLMTVRVSVAGSGGRISNDGDLHSWSCCGDFGSWGVRAVVPEQKPHVTNSGKRSRIRRDLENEKTQQKKERKARICFAARASLSVR